jgi:zinc transport system ATP-binding protein
MSIISLDKISVEFDGLKVLDDISLEVAEGDYIGLIGPNGAGKSTLLKTLVGIVSPTCGNVTVSEKVKFGYVPQNYLLEGQSSLSAREVMEMGLPRSGFFKDNFEESLFVDKLFIVGLEGSILDKSFDSLSGGQKQRVIIARSLLDNPNVLLFDEPLSGVDYTTKIQIYELLNTINSDHKTAIIFVSHEIESVVQKCKRIVCLNRKIHEGCHPIDFMHGKLDKCSVLEASTTIKAIHHHHDNSEKC